MSEAEFQREDREYERQLERREELEREDIMSVAVDPWLHSQRLAHAIVDRAVRRPPQPVAALLDCLREEWEAV